MSWFSKVGDFIKDVAVASVDSALSSVGQGNVIKDSSYSSQKFASAATGFQTVTNKVGTAVVTYFVPPLGAGVAYLQKNNAPKPSGSSATVDESIVPDSLQGFNYTLDPALISQNSPVDEEDNTAYFIVGGVLLVLLVLILIYLLK
jgi:hypothetical protein